MRRSAVRSIAWLGAAVELEDTLNVSKFLFGLLAFWVEVRPSRSHQKSLCQKVNNFLADLLMNGIPITSATILTEHGVISQNSLRIRLTDRKKAEMRGILDL